MQTAMGPDRMPRASIQSRAMRRLLALTTSTIVGLLLLAPVALAHDGGEGYYGQTNDKVVTIAGFALILFFPRLRLLREHAPGASREAQGRSPRRREGARQEPGVASRLVSAGRRAASARAAPSAARPLA